MRLLELTMDVIIKERNGLRVGKIYQMSHSRKGNARVKILVIEGEWIDVEIVKGSVKGIGAGSYRETGDTLRVRESLASFKAVE